jgi:hypothetical protein
VGEAAARAAPAEPSLLAHGHQSPPADEAEPRRPQHRAAGASASRTRPAMAVIAWAASLAGAVAT